MEQMNGRSATLAPAPPLTGPDGPLVQDWMTSPARAARPDTTFLAAYAQMMDARIHRLPVVDGGQLVGVVTLADLQPAHPARTIGQVMTGRPLAVTPTTPIAQAARLMLAHKIDGLPVVDGAGRLVGIITQTDLVRLLLRQGPMEEQP